MKREQMMVSGNPRWLSYIFGDFEGSPVRIVDGDPDAQWPFVVRQGIVSDRAPRDKSFEVILDMGRWTYPYLFDGNKDLNCRGDLFLCFPERWTSYKEQEMLLETLALNYSAKDITRVSIITQVLHIGRYCTRHSQLWLDEPED